MTDETHDSHSTTIRCLRFTPLLVVFHAGCSLLGFINGETFHLTPEKTHLSIKSKLAPAVSRPSRRTDRNRRMATQSRLSSRSCLLNLWTIPQQEPMPSPTRTERGLASFPHNCAVIGLAPVWAGGKATTGDVTPSVRPGD